MIKGADIPKDRALDSQLAQSLIGRDAPHDLIVNRDFVTRIGNLCDVAFVRKLSISFNQIHSLDGIDQLPQLRQLIAYACEIDKIECLKTLPKIEMVMLQQNKIYKMNDTFSGLSKLQELRLDQNKISKIEFLSGCVSLRKLDLSFNNIDSLVGLSGLQQLQELKVSNNLIKSLAPLKALPSIKDLDVSNNQLKSIDGLQQMPTLEFVKADHNMITELKVSAMLGSNKRVTSEVSKEKTADKKPSSGSTKKAQGAVVELAETVGPMLVEISLSGNRIRSVEGLELFKNTLESVDLSSNNLAVSEMSNIVATLKQCAKLNELRMYMNPIVSDPETLQRLGDQLTQACPSLRAFDGLSIVASTDPLAASNSQAGFHTWNDDASTTLDGGRSVGETLKDDMTQGGELSEADSEGDSDSEKDPKEKGDAPEAKRFPSNLMLQEMLTPEEIVAKETEIRNGLKYCKDRLESATRSVFGFAEEVKEDQPAFKARRLLASTPSASGLRVAAALEEADTASRSAKFVAPTVVADIAKPNEPSRQEERVSAIALKEKLVDRVRLAVSSSVGDVHSPHTPAAASEKVLAVPRPSSSGVLQEKMVNRNTTLLTDDVLAASDAKSSTESPASRRGGHAENSPNSRADSKSVSSVSSAPKSKYHVPNSILGVGPAVLGTGLSRHGTKVKSHANKSRPSEGFSQFKPSSDDSSPLHSGVAALRTSGNDVDELNVHNLKITKPSQNVYMTEWDPEPMDPSEYPAPTKVVQREPSEYKEYSAPQGALEPMSSPFREYASSSDEEGEDDDQGQREYFRRDPSRLGTDMGEEDDQEDVPAKESEVDQEDSVTASSVLVREVRLRPDDRFGRAVAAHGGGFDVRGLHRGSEPPAVLGGDEELLPGEGDASAVREAAQRAVQSLRRGFSAPNMDRPASSPSPHIDTQDYKHDSSEPPPQSPAGSLTSSASLVSLSSYKPLLVPSAATATLLASAGSLSPRPGPAQAVNTFSQPKMKFNIPQSARNAINQGVAAGPNTTKRPRDDSKELAGPAVEVPQNAALISDLEKEIFRASKMSVSKQRNPTTPLMGAVSGPFSPRADYK